MRLRLVALPILLALLGGCNVAMSDKPLFQEAQRSSALLLQDGLWVLDEPDCSADLAKPRAQWPGCVDWVIVSANKAVLSSDSKPDEGADDIFIVEGKPPLVQARVISKGSEPFYAYLVF